jgi:AraC family transcriptional regulator
MNSPEVRTEVVFGTDGLRFLQIDYRSERRMPLHSHADAACLSCCLSGTVEERWERVTFAHTPPVLSLLPAGLPHANRFSSGTRLFLAVIGTTWAARDERLAALVSAPLHCEEARARWTAARMHREFRRRDDLTPLALEGMLLELLTEVSRGALRSPPPGAPRWLPQVKEFLHAHFRESVSTADLAAAVGVHPSHLMRSFRQHFRCTIGEYLRRLRVEYACHLLAEPGRSLVEVAIEAGFADQSHFNHLFKRQTGTTPGAYAAASRGSSRGPSAAGS